MASLYILDYCPLMGWLDNLTGALSRLNKNCEEMDLFYQELITEHLDPERTNSMQDDIIDIFLQLKKDNSSSIEIALDHIKIVLMVIHLFLVLSFTFLILYMSWIN